MARVLRNARLSVGITGIFVIASCRSDFACSPRRSNAGPAAQPITASEQSRNSRLGIDGGSDASMIRFIAIGDTGKGNDNQRRVARAMDTKCAASGCDFALLLGDNIYPSGPSSDTDPQFKSKFEEPYAGLNFPFYAVLGNHDYGGGGFGTEPAKGPYSIKYTQHSSKWTMPAAWYHFKRGPSEFFALDTTARYHQRDEHQEDDVNDWIRSSKSPWKIAFGHHPYLSNGQHGNAGTYESAPHNGDAVKSLLESTVCGRVDLYLCGHDHNRQWLTAQCRGTEFAVSGAGAIAASLPGQNPVLFESSALGFLYIRIEGETLTAEFVDAEGQTNFTRTLTKKRTPQDKPE